MSSHPLRRPSAVALTALALVAAPLAAGFSTPATAASTTVVINEVYVNGGSNAATYTNKYVELYNKTGAAIDLSGMSIQYRSPTGTSVSTGNVPLTGTIPANGYFTVSGGSNGADGAAVPGVDQVAAGALNPGGGGGTVTLVAGTTAVNPASSTDVVDKLGYGTSNTPEGSGSGPSGNSVTMSLGRDDTSADSDVNAADFVAQTPTPDAVNPAGGGAGGGTDQGDQAIADIQGTGPASPLVGDTVTTEGVVTASYPEGGFNSFVIQTEGTGGSTDATPGASDAVQVFPGSLGAASFPEIGDSIEVTGTVSERFDTTQITTTGADITDVTPALSDVTPLSAAYPTTETAREAHELELLAPTDEFTVTNTFGTNQYGEVGLATGSQPLIQPTDVEDFQTGDVAGVTADNLARGVVLDDGASTDYLGAGEDSPLPYLSPSNPIRVGAGATLTGPVVLKYDFGVWRFEPTEQVTDEGADVATFENTRLDNQQPTDVGGDVRLATFNVLNYFPTTGEEFVASGLGTCSYYTDRDGNNITDNRCDPDGPRGAADDENLQRQQTKIVTAINGLDASVVSLEEIENSAKYGKDRDVAVSTLVDALNAAAGSQVWDFVPSPADRPDVDDEDVIRTAFIYKPADLAPVGQSEILQDEENFDNAREPLAQAFKATGAADADAFGVIVNHFKSKGSAPSSGDNADNGQGGFNADRIGQANALSAFADSFAADRGIEATFLTGDFNSYTQEDPLQVLYEDGYTNLASDTEGEVTYSFGGLSGSLDHVLANDAALAMVSGVDIWNINSPESVAFEYSRYNYNATNFYQSNQFRASDHDPEIIGIDLAGGTGGGEGKVRARVGFTTSPGQPVQGNRARLKITVRTNADDVSLRGAVYVSIKGRQRIVTRFGDNNRAVVRTSFPRAGRQVVQVRYVGNSEVAQTIFKKAVTVRRTP